MNSYFGTPWWKIWRPDREQLREFASAYVGGAALVAGTALLALGVALKWQANAR